MDRRQVLSLSGALAAASLGGCMSDGQPPTEPSSPSETSTGTPSEEPPSGEPNVDDEQLAALATGNATFALDLHGHLAARDGGNQFLSPYSISVALAMTYGGARSATREQMQETMRYTLGEDVHAAFADHRAAIESRATTTDPGNDEEVDAFQIAVANALWGREGFPFAEEYLALLSDHYEAGLRRAEFTEAPDAARARINEWVADATEDRIEDLLPRGSITPQTVLVLTNAIYFMASWDQEFDPENTEAGTFTTVDGATTTVPFMHQHLRAEYASIPGAEIVELPYVGREVSMVLILPDEGEFEAYERRLDADHLFGIFEELGDAAGDLAFPKFEFETKVPLSKALAELGMPDAFGGDADFGGMVEGEGSGLFLDEVYHQAYVSVDEEGTEAAAATAVAAADSMPPDWGELRFDRPFLFCIRDRPTDAVLFLGRVVDLGDG